MNFWQAIVMGLVQGLTEFLPVSSSGHIILFEKLLNIDVGDNDMFLGIMLHVGTLLSLFTVYGSEVLSLFKRGSGKKLWYLFVATVPAVAVGLLFEDSIEGLFGGTFLCFGFLITAILLLVVERVSRSGSDGEITFKSALTMGVFQAVAVIPGISRSGSTIAGGTFAGLKKNKVADFSFLMSIPIIGGAACYELIKALSSGAYSAVSPWCLAAAMIVSAVSGYFAIKFMLRIIGKANYKWFSLYLLVLFAVTFIDTYVVSFM